MPDQGIALVREDAMGRRQARGAPAFYVLNGFGFLSEAFKQTGRSWWVAPALGSDHWPAMAAVLPGRDTELHQVDHLLYQKRGSAACPILARVVIRRCNQAGW